MFRTVRRWFSDTETRALAEDVQKVQDQILTMAHRVEGLQLRIERMTNRVNMRMARAGLPREDDDELMRQMREGVTQHGPTRNGDIFDEPPPVDWR